MAVQVQLLRVVALLLFRRSPGWVPYGRNIALSYCSLRKAVDWRALEGSHAVEPTTQDVETTYFFGSTTSMASTEERISDSASEVRLSSLSAKVQEKLLASTLDIQVPGPGASREGSYFQAAAPARALAINLDLLNYRAKREQKRGKPSAARRMWKQCIEIDRHDGRAWLALSRDAERELRDPRLAAQYLTEGLYHNPTNAHIRQAYGIFLERQGLRRQALEQFERAIRNDPFHAASYVAKARLLERRCRTARKQAGNGVTTWISPSTSREAEAYEEARRCYALAMRAEPTNEQALVACAMFEAGSGRTEAARALFQRAVRANPKNAAAHAAWAKIEEEERPHKARLLYAAAHTVHPSNTRALTAWARFELKCGNATAAVDLLRKATRVRTGRDGYRGGCVDASVFATLGDITWRHCRDPNGARSAFRRAVAVGPADNRAYRSWATMETKLGNLDDARNILQQGIWGCTSGVTDRRRLAELWRDVARVEVAQARKHLNATILDAARAAFRKAIDLCVSDLNGDAGMLTTAIFVEWANFETQLPAGIGRRREVLHDAFHTLPEGGVVASALKKYKARPAKISTSSQGPNDHSTTDCADTPTDL